MTGKTFQSIRWDALTALALSMLLLSPPVQAEQESVAGFDFKSVISGVAPSVVRVYAEGSLRAGLRMVKVTRQASGVVLSADGFVVTQNSIIIDPARVFIRTTSDDKVPAKVVLRDPDADLVFLKVETPGLKPIPLGKLDQVLPGQTVLHIGNAFGLAQGKNDELSVNHGVVNSIHPMDPSGKGYSGKIIQTDAGFNPGGYGGALVNLKGELIGIAAPVVTSRRTNTEINFAIPVDEVEHRLQQARHDLANPPKPPTPKPAPAPKPAPSPDVKPAPEPPQGKNPGYLGAYLLEDSEGTRGAYVDKVVPGSPAELAGLKSGDLITAVDSRPVKNGGDFIDSLDKGVEGQVLKLTVERQGVRVDIEVKLGKVPQRVLR